MSDQNGAGGRQDGLLFLLVGPSGAGKNRLISEVQPRIPDLSQMPTATTRPPRSNETHGVQHFFLSDEEFDRLEREGAFAECQVVHFWRYGMILSVVEQALRAGHDHIADVDVLGAQALRSAFPEHVVLIFVSASRETLERRLRARGNIDEHEIQTRLRRAEFECQYAEQCDYRVENNDLGTAVEQVMAAIRTERRRRKVANG